LFEKFGTSDINYKIAGDYEFFLRTQGQIKAIFIDEVTVVAQAGISSSLTFRIVREMFYMFYKHTTLFLAIKIFSKAMFYSFMLNGFKTVLPKKTYIWLRKIWQNL